MTPIDFEVKGQGHSDIEREKLVRVITWQCLNLWPSNLTWTPIDFEIIEKLVWVVTWQCLHPWPSKVTWWLGVTSRWPLLILSLILALVNTLKNLPLPNYLADFQIILQKCSFGDILQDLFKSCSLVAKTWPPKLVIVVDCLVDMTNHINQVSDQGPSWPSCFKSCLLQMHLNAFISGEKVKILLQFG